MRLTNRVALVTGAGTGIGRAIAELFAREGARVAVNYSRSEKAAQEVVAGIQSEGQEAIAVRADVSRESDVLAMIERVRQTFGRLDILVNNAGWSTLVPHEQLDLLTDDIWDRTLNTNLRGTFYCVRAAVPLLRAQDSSSVINVASVAGLSGHGSSVAYAASKGGMLAMTKSLARALAPRIRVNAIAPGLVSTGFAGWTDEACQAAAKITPLQRVASVEDVANAALFLAAAGHAITGEIITVDGGLHSLGSFVMHRDFNR